MKDEQDKQTSDFLIEPARADAEQPAAARSPVQPRKPPRRLKPFDAIRSVSDEKTFGELKPKCAKTVLAFGFEGGHFVPVSFVAKDWSVTPRRIRALLCDGRLAGRLQDNGYWEVRYPYAFTFGTRGPGLKRQQKQERRAA